MGRLVAEAEAARMGTAADAAREEGNRVVVRWRAAEERAADSEAQLLSLKTRLHDATTQLQIAQSQASAAKTAAAAGPNPADELAAARRLLRDAETERETIADILASIIPLPSFVRERAAEGGGVVIANGTGLSRPSNTRKSLPSTSSAPIWSARKACSK